MQLLQRERANGGGGASIGKYSSTHDEAGLVACSNPCGRELRFVSKRKQLCDIPLSKVIDLSKLQVFFSFSCRMSDCQSRRRPVGRVGSRGLLH